MTTATAMATATATAMAMATATATAMAMAQTVGGLWTEHQRAPPLIYVATQKLFQNS